MNRANRASWVTKQDTELVLLVTFKSLGFYCHNILMAQSRETHTTKDSGSVSTQNSIVLYHAVRGVD